jgi:Ax21 family sulfation-dependent quorum factor
MKRSLLALVMLAALPLTAQAAQPNYNYLEADYVSINIQDVDDMDNAEGFGLRGSWAMTDSFYLFGSYLSGSTEISEVDVDVDQSQLGVGFRHGVTETTDFIAELSWLNQSIDVEGLGEEDGNGGRLSAGFRHSFDPKFDGFVKANYTDGNDFDGDFSGTVGAFVKFNETWGITAEAEVGGDADIYTLGVRASF